MRPNISIAILAAIAGGGMLPMTDINVPGKSLFRREHNRSRDGTRSNRSYAHDVIQMEQVHRDHFLGVDWVNRWKEFNRQKRRAERKGINTVPRAPVSSLHAISFG